MQYWKDHIMDTIAMAQRSFLHLGFPKLDMTAQLVLHMQLIMLSSLKFDQFLPWLLNMV
jgi:hypothetical protein